MKVQLSSISKKVNVAGLAWHCQHITESNKLATTLLPSSTSLYILHSLLLMDSSSLLNADKTDSFWVISASLEAPTLPDCKSLSNRAVSDWKYSDPCHTHKGFICRHNQPARSSSLLALLPQPKDGEQRDAHLLLCLLHDLHVHIATSLLSVISELGYSSLCTRAAVKGQTSSAQQGLPDSMMTHTLQQVGFRASGPAATGRHKAECTLLACRLACLSRVGMIWGTLHLGILHEGCQVLGGAELAGKIVEGGDAGKALVLGHCILQIGLEGLCSAPAGIAATHSYVLRSSEPLTMQYSIRQCSPAGAKDTRNEPVRLQQRYMLAGGSLLRLRYWLAPWEELDCGEALHIKPLAQRPVSVGIHLPGVLTQPACRVCLERATAALSCCMQLEQAQAHSNNAGKTDLGDNNAVLQLGVCCNSRPKLFVFRGQVLAVSAPATQDQGAL